MSSNPRPDERAWLDLLENFVRDGKVVAGQDGWLFLDNDRNDFLQQVTGERTLTDRQLEQWRELLEARTAQIEALGAPYHFMVAPESAAVYPEALPEKVELCEERPVGRLMRHLASRRSPTSFIYPLGDLRAEKHRRCVYRKTDTHWNEFGAFVAYRRLVRELSQGVALHEVTEEELLFVEADLPGDLAYKLDVESGLTWCARYVYATARVVHDNRVHHHGSLVVTECPHAPPTRCLIFGDSSNYSMLPFLAQSFGRLVFAQMPTIDYDLIREEHPDVVVSQMVERYLIEVPNESLARTIRELESAKLAKGTLRPRFRYWDRWPPVPAESRPPSVEVVEAARAHLIARDRLEDAALISLMAYAGLSPDEALRLAWRHLEDGVVTVQRTFAGVPEVRERSVPLYEPLAEDLADWRAACGTPQHGYVFPNLRKQESAIWVRKVYLPAITQANRSTPALAVLSRTFVGLLIHDGVPLSGIAALTGIERDDIANDYWYLLHETPLYGNAGTASDLIRRVRATALTARRTDVFTATLYSRFRRRPLESEGIGWDALPQEESPGVSPLSADTVESIRARLLLSEGDVEGATFVSALAYAGLHHHEALHLRWRNVADGALGIGDPRRSIALLDPLADDLTEWRAATGSPQRGWVFPNLRKRKWQDWVRDYRRAAGDVGSGRGHPDFLKHTFGALLIGEGALLDEVARQIGLSRQETIARYSSIAEEAYVRGPTSASLCVQTAREAVTRNPAGASDLAIPLAG